MPKKAGQTPEQKQEAFKQWKESDEWKALMNFAEVRLKDDAVNGIDNAYKDIWQDW